jgi:Leucine-rich repeat (LRR) protein
VNCLKEITASQFKGLMMLEELDLRSNAIHTVERDALRHMEHLRTIDLSGNCLFELKPYIFFRNIRLTNIHFNDNFLESLPVLMPFSQRIDHLNVTANRFTNLTSLIYYENIQSLDLSHNPLSMSKEMSGHMTDVAMVNGRRGSDSDTSSSSRSGEENNYTMRLHYNSNEYIRRRPRSRRHDNQDYFSRASAVNSIGRRCARVNGDFAEYNDIRFISERMSEEALKALIRISLNASDAEMVTLCNAFRRRQKVMKRSPRNDHYVQLTQQQIQQLQEYKSINRLEYFTCRNCTLHSLDFLVHFPKLKYVEVSSNMIKSVDSTKLASLEHIEYLDLSDNNELESLNIASLLQSWPKLNALNLNNNPNLKCDMAAKIRTHVEHLNKIFKLKVNKCK